MSGVCFAISENFKAVDSGEINKRTFEDDVAKPSILGTSLPSKQEETLGPTHSPLTLLCDISSCP